MLLESYTKKNTFNDRYIMLLHTDQDWKFDLHLLKVVKCHILVNCHTYGLFVQDIQEYCVSGCFYILNLNTKIVFVLENHLCHSFIHVVLFFSLNNIHVVSYGWSSVISLFCLIFCISVRTLIRKNAVALVKLYLSYLFIIFTFFNVEWHGGITFLTYYSRGLNMKEMVFSFPQAILIFLLYFFSHPPRSWWVSQDVSRSTTNSCAKTSWGLQEYFVGTIMVPFLPL